jgi:hypothetical protein
MGRGKAVTKKGPGMSTTNPAEVKSAEEKLLDSVGELIDSAAETMTAEEFRLAAKRSNEILDRALARPRQRRETA